jgi:hypothetical protein
MTDKTLAQPLAQLRLKVKTRPGDIQYVARRRALGLIEKAFDAKRHRIRLSDCAGRRWLGECHRRSGLCSGRAKGARTGKARHERMR